MRLKGHGNIAPLGCIEIDDGCSYFYYVLNDGSLIELEVVFDQDRKGYTRRVTAFVASAEDVRELLAS